MWMPSEGRFRKPPNKPSVIQSNHEGDKPPRVTLAENFREYCLNTTIHGFKYIGTIGLSSFERVFFTISFISVSILSIYFISNVYHKWQSTPIIMGINPVATHIRDIPFPAVTICNMNQVRRTAAEMINTDSVEYMVLDSICSLDSDDNHTNYEGKWSVVENLLLSATQPCHQMILACRYAKTIQRCSHMFQPVLTDEGLCCTFNNLDPSFMLQHDDITKYQDNDPTNPFQPIEWTPEGGFVGVKTNQTFPRAIAGTGAHMGLTVVLDANVNDYFCSSTSSQGFKMLLHNPTETPKMAEYSQYINVGTENRVIVYPKLSDASYLIRKVAQSQRQCVFANEANLSYYRTYSRNNCEMECEARLVQENCGCVLYYMPKLQEDTKICNKADAPCYEEIKSFLAFRSNTSRLCNCLPGCFEISYTTVISTAELCIGNFKVREKLLSHNNSYARKNIALVYIFFSETYFRSLIKGELVGFTDFLSNVGGLLGLFMGFSLISLAEVIYFITLRPLFANRREAEKQLARARKLNQFHGSAFTQKSQRHVHFSNDIGHVQYLSSKIKRFFCALIQQPSIWLLNIFRTRLFNSNRNSTFPFYE
ncbi:pickpocket protein 28 [Malaya genurostris]|uniref:pickpocket protein 28 n=1 Tax=Malaya genurostris TaxID=325434 RepID=UPI0026F3B544|nr:pickpocket protein 28 [Malaya genurostris]